MTLRNDSIDQNLEQAMHFLEKAVNLSVEQGLGERLKQKEIGRKWEEFFGQFLGCVHQKSIEHNVNLMGWVTFPRWRR